MTSIIGWDLGGANLKLARLEEGRVVQVAQIPCPIRQERSKFDEALGEGLKLCPGGACHAVTMTGELSDVFVDRGEGVAYLVGMMREATGDGTVFYAGRAGFLDAGKALERYLDMASANWHASAALVATKCREGLFIDAGTTTTDIIPLKSAVPAARGYPDAERLSEGELIYAAVVRTPVMAIACEVPFKGRAQGSPPSASPPWLTCGGWSASFPLMQILIQLQICTGKARRRAQCGSHACSGATRVMPNLPIG